MKEELNIAAILKDKPLYTKLWSDTFGDMFLTECSVDSFNVKGRDDNLIWTYLSNGTFKKYMGVLSIFPSKAMRSWEKFAWKKGDVLTTKTKSLTVVFDYFNATYESFGAKYSFCSYHEKNENDSWKKDGENSYKTECFHKVSDEEAKEFIKKVEEHYGGKLNLETLGIEKPKPEFKDGDIVFIKGAEGYKDYIEIFSHFDDGEICDHAVYDIKKRILDCSGKYPIGEYEYQDIRLATDSEKQQLFDALAKENKKWDENKKMLVDLPKKCELKPFDKVLVRDTDAGVWMPTLFGFYDKEFNNYVCLNDVFQKCIPYNDQTKHLLGTTDEWKGGGEG